MMTILTRNLQVSVSLVVDFAFIFLKYFMCTIVRISLKLRCAAYC